MGRGRGWPGLIGSNTLPGRIDGSGATPGRAGAGVRKHTCVRTRTRPSDWGVAPNHGRYRVVAYTVAPARIAGRAEVCIGPPRRLHTPVRP